jgi:hypothetical protein
MTVRYSIFSTKATNIEGDYLALLIIQTSNILDVRLFRTADCDTGHYLVVTKVR